MSRLIDADKLRHELIMGHDLVGAKYVDMADTVKAIPIEWIKKQIEKYVEWTTFKFHIDVDDIEARDCLEYLLEDWEKENENN